MGVNNKIDMQKVATNAGKLSTGGKNVAKYFFSAYNELKKMGDYWWGTNYNELVTAMNGLVTSFNDMSKTITVEIPTSLQTAMKNYANAFHTTAPSVAVQSPQTLSALSLPSKTEVKYDEAKVSASKTAIDTQFNNAIKAIDGEITTAVNNIKNNWQGEAGVSAEKKIKEISKTVKENVNEINKQFKQSMEAARQAVSSAENANMYN